MNLNKESDNQNQYRIEFCVIQVLKTSDDFTNIKQTKIIFADLSFISFISTHCFITITCWENQLRLD